MSPAERFRQLTCTRTLHSDLASRSVRATIFTAASGFADFAIRLGSTAILARLIIPEHFGLVMMASAIVAVADQLRELGLSTATVQQPSISHAEVTNLFWVNVAVSSSLALTLCAASPLISRYYQDPRLLPIACVLASTLIAGGLTVQHQALLTRQLKLGHAAAIRLASSALSTTLALVLAWLEFGYWSLLWREVARAVLLGAGMWICFPWVPGLPYWKTNIRPLLRFGANLTGANILASISAGFDRFLLGRVAGAGPVGLYRQAYQLVAAPTDQLLSPLYQVAQPSLSLVQGDAARFRRLYAKVLTLVCILTMPLSVFVAVHATEITLLFLGPAWLEVAPILCLLSFGTFIKQTASSTAFVLIARGRGGAYFALTAVHNTLLILALCIGVRWGVHGVALADVAVTYLMLAPRLRYSLAGSPVSIRFFLTTLARPVTASLALAIALLALPDHFAGESTGSAVRVGVGALIAIVTFCGTWLVLPGGRAEARSLIHDLHLAVQRKTAPVRPLKPAVVRS